MTTSPWEHLQSTLMTYYNRDVREAFRDDIADDDFTTPEGVLRNSCLIKDNDTATMCNIKMMNFLFVRQRKQLLDGILIGKPEYGMDGAVPYHPQVTIFLEEKDRDYRRRIQKHSRDEHPRKKVVQVSFRYMDKTSETFGQGEISRLKIAIPQIFTPTYRFKTGRFKHSYRDPQNGYRMILSGYSKQESRELIDKVLQLRNNQPNWDYFTASTSDKSFSTKESITVLGKRQRLPARRQVAEVYFRKAELYLYGIQKPISLFDRHV